jgi:adenylate cyclase class 2
MSDSGQEIEAKFYVRDLERILKFLQNLGARLIQPRVVEMNIRFDLPGAPLRAEGRVVRLRQDTEAKLTYKSGSQNEEGVLSREEIEFVVESFEKAKRFLEALGYQKLISYEKFRTIYELDQTSIMLDELPYGNFVEVEGENNQSIRAVTDKLHLKWDTAIATSYTAIFERARKALNLSFQDISFANFADVKVESTDLGVRPADE